MLLLFFGILKKKLKIIELMSYASLSFFLEDVLCSCSYVYLRAEEKMSSMIGDNLWAQQPQNK
jgi:hypothetical protein